MSKLMFHEKVNSNSNADEDGSWGVLVVDDDMEVHAMTRFVMKGWQFQGKEIRLVSAYSSVMAKEILQKDHDFCLILLDVVMEHDDSGLNLVRFVREELGDRLIRIILRTGQPGKAPVRKIINDYEINDYKEKSELTADRLFVAVTAALRSYNDLLTIEQNKEGLEKVLEATQEMYEGQSMRSFANGILYQVSGLMESRGDSLFVQHDKTKAGDQFDPGRVEVLASSGQYQIDAGKSLNALQNPQLIQSVSDTFTERKSHFNDDNYYGYFPISDTVENVLVFNGLNKVEDFKKQLLTIYSKQAEAAFKNLYLNKEIEESQKEVICTLGEVVESRSRETAKHIQRVTEISVVMGKALGMDRENLTLMQLAAPMHDVGKIGIPDEVLHKPGLLDKSEFELMKTHTQIGYEILQNSQRPVMKTAAAIALEHHERWDGTGYPYGKRGEEICQPARIVGLVDVFDALYNRRIYKEPWPLDRILEIIRFEKSGHFDPDAVDCFLDSIDEIVQIEDSNRDDY